MPRRTLARQNLLTFAVQPWNLYEDDPGAGGGGGGGTGVNEHGYPDGTPTADMTPEHQIAYWKHHARKHEQRANTAPDAAELERLRAAAAELATRKAADLTESERLQAEKQAAEAARIAAEAARDAAVADALRIRVAAEKGLTPAQAERLRGTTAEELEADADALKSLFGAPHGGSGQGAGSRSGGPRGGEVGGTRSTATGAELYRQRHGKN
jgi:membrane protein involved in colicin uptake